MEKFKKSKYNLELKIDNKNYIFNSLLGSCISFSEKEYLNYLNEDFSNFSKKDLDSLIELGIVTQESVNETQIYLNLLEKENLNEKKRFYRILTTTDCNAKCYYCY